MHFRIYPSKFCETSTVPTRGRKKALGGVLPDYRRRTLSFPSLSDETGTFQLVNHPVKSDQMIGRSRIATPTRTDLYHICKFSNPCRKGGSATRGLFIYFLASASHFIIVSLYRAESFFLWGLRQQSV
jgi:hypothetical protein